MSSLIDPSRSMNTAGVIALLETFSDDLFISSTCNVDMVVERYSQLLAFLVLV